MNPQLTIPHAAVRDFCRSHAVRELAVLGPAARDDFRPDSDIDVPIDPAPDARVGLVTLQRMRDELAGIIGRPVELLGRNGLNRHVRDQSLLDAEIVHAE